MSRISRQDKTMSRLISRVTLFEDQDTLNLLNDITRDQVRTNGTDRVREFVRWTRTQTRLTFI